WHKVSSQLLLAYAADAATRICSALSVTQSLPAYVRSEDVDVPRVGKGKGIHDRDRDGIWLFTGGAAGAPNAQRSRILPEFLGMQFGQHALFKCLVHRRITEERCLLRQQSLQQRLLFQIRFANGPQQVAAALLLLRVQMLTHARGEESLTRLVEMNSRPLFDQHADLAQFVFAQTVSRPVAFAHGRPTLAPEYSPELELVATAKRPLGRAGVALPTPTHSPLIGVGIAPPVLSIGSTVSRAD